FAPEPLTGSNHRSVRHDGRLGDDHDAFTDHIVFPCVFLHALAVDDLDVPADAAILVHDRPLDHRAITYGKIRDASAPVLLPFRLGFIAVGTKEYRVAQRDLMADPAADAD